MSCRLEPVVAREILAALDNAAATNGPHTLDWLVRAGGPRVRVRITCAYVPGPTSPAAAAQTWHGPNALGVAVAGVQTAGRGLWVAQYEDLGALSARAYVSDVLGTRDDPAMWPASAGLYGWSEEYSTAADGFFGRLVLGNPLEGNNALAGHDAGAIVVAARWEPSDLMSLDEWRGIRGGLGEIKILRGGAVVIGGGGGG